MTARGGEITHEGLRAPFSAHPMVGEIRGLGLIGAVEFAARCAPAQAFDPALRMGARISKAAVARGLITRPLPNSDTIVFSPPPTISDDEIAHLGPTRPRSG